MTSATYQQTNFLAGEWSPFYQGRSDHPKYRSAMNLCLNGYPIEEGAWNRRSGTRLCCPTFKGQAAKLYPVFFTDTAPYDVEFTDGNIRFINGAFPVITAEMPSVANVSTANPAVVTLSAPLAWNTDDEVAFVFDPSSQSGSAALLLRQRTFLITMIPETYAAWSNTTTYGLGSLVASGGVNYISVQAGNLNKTPASNVAWWTPLVTGASRTFSIRDAITGTAIDGAALSLSTFLGVFILRSLRLATPYTAGAWETARIVQNQHVALVVNGTHIPQALQITPNLGSNQAATASIKDVYFQDGPYLDPVKNSLATLSGLSGVVTVTVNFAAYDNTKTYDIGDYVLSGATAFKSLAGGNLGNDPATNPTLWLPVDNGVAVTGPGHATVTGFQATDVGRLMRFYSEPALYIVGGTYSVGNIVEYNDLVYQALQNNAATDPDSDITIWKPLPTGALWTWGKITAVTNTNTVTLQILGDPLLYNLDIRTWRLGVYSDTSGWPTCGVFTEGRFMFGGAMPNRFDLTMTFGVTEDGVVNMAPTDKYGTVLDSSGISYTLEGEDQNPIYWFSLDHQGVLAGTKGGEWMVTPSVLNEALTPRNIKAIRVTKYKAADIEPKRTGISLVFVQAFKRRVMEFLADVFTGRFIAPNLSEPAKHLTQDNVEELGYQEELTPILWCRTRIGKLIGATYRRRSMMSSEAPEFVGWHQHALGHNRTIESIAVGPNADGTLDALAMVTNDATIATPVRWVEQMTLMFDESDSLYDAWFLDGGAVPDNMYEDTVAGQLGQRITGLWYYQGKTLTVFIGGLDVGDLTVDTNGSIFIPYGSGVAPAVFDYTAAGAGAYLFTAAYVAYVKSLNLHLKNGGISIGGSTTVVKTKTTTNPNNTSKVQNLQPTEAVRSDELVVDWATGKALFDYNRTSISVMNMISGAEIQNKSINTILGETGDGYDSVADVDSHGNVYTQVSSLTVNMLKMDTLTLTKIAAGGNSSATSFPNVSSLAVIEANSEYLVGVTNTPNLAIGKAADMTLLAGNSSTDPGYMGYNQTEWHLEGNGGLVSGGAATHGGNVASSYLIQPGTAWPASFTYYFIGVADGVPSAASSTAETAGKKGKGKGKKGASPATNTPSVATPQVYFAKIGDLPASAVDPHWTSLANWDGCIVDEQDNSVITYLGTVGSGLSAWSGATTYAAGDLATTGSGSSLRIYVANVASLNINPDTDVSGSAFPYTGTNWNLVPKDYLVSVTTGQYSRNNTGAFGVKWVVPINESPTFDKGMSQGRIKGGLFGFISSTLDASGQTPVYLIDTSTGAYFVGVMPGIVQLGRPQAWDDQSQSFVCYGSYTSTVALAPTALNSTVTFSNNWMRLYVGNLTISSSIKSTLLIQPNGYTFLYTDNGGAEFPCVVGSTYTSRGQTLRAIAPEQSGAKLGPALGKTRRTHKYAALFHNTMGISVGTGFGTNELLPANFVNDATNAPYDPATLYSGLWKDALEGGYDFDSMLSWQITRPYPATVVSIGAFLKTQDD